VLEQSYKTVEYIVIDGASTDGSIAVLKQYEDQLSFWISEPDEGIYDAMNKGIDQATGDYFLFLNSGDYLVDNHVFKKFKDFNPIEDIIYGNTLLHNNGEYELKEMPKNLNIARALTNTINHQAIFFKKNLFDDGTRYDCTYEIVADWVLVNTAIIYKNCTARHIDLTIPCYDVNGVSSDLSLRAKEREKYIKANFDPYFIQLLNLYTHKERELVNLKNNIVIKKLFRLKKRLTFFKSLFS